MNTLPRHHRPLILLARKLGSRSSCSSNLNAITLIPIIETFITIYQNPGAKAEESGFTLLKKQSVNGIINCNVCDCAVLENKLDWVTVYEGIIRKSCICVTNCWSRKRNGWKMFIIPRGKLREHNYSLVYSDLVWALDFNKALDGFALKLQEEMHVLKWTSSHCYCMFKAAY